MKVFISYSRKDIQSAIKLYESLKENGISTWIDTENILPGQNWKFTIRKAIKSCDYFLALLSNSSISKRGYVQKELKIALEILDESPASDVFIIPVRLENCEPVDERLYDIQWVDLFPSFENGVKKIISYLKTDEIENYATLEIEAFQKEKLPEDKKYDNFMRTDSSGKNIFYKLDISFEEALNGCIKDLKVNRKELCSVCNGKTNLIFTCSNCNGTGFKDITENISLNVPAGVDTGTKLRVLNRGNILNRDQSPGHLYIEVHVQGHQKFRRKGKDLYVELFVPSKVADIGGKQKIELFGKSVMINIPKGIKMGNVLRLKGCGIKDVYSDNFGDLYCNVYISLS